MKMIVGGAERKQTSSFPLHEHDTRDPPKSRHPSRNRAVIFEPERHVIADRLRAMMPTIAMRGFVEWTRFERRSAHSLTSSRDEQSCALSSRSAIQLAG